MSESLPAEAVKDLHVFRKSLPARVRLDAIVRALGDIEGQSCLDVGLDSSVMSYYLRKKGGDWQTLVFSDPVAQSVRGVVEENVQVAEDDVLPFDNKCFDAVVAADCLERLSSHDRFIEECHRVLKPDGRLIINVTHRKPVTCIRFVRRLLGSQRVKRGLVNPGYSDSELFGLLKHGFDVLNVRSYSRFNMEFTDALVQCLAQRLASSESDADKKVMQLFSIASPFYHLAAQMDMLLFFTKGHYLIASAKRRAWRPRKAPVLTDGRSITEAVLKRAPK